MNERKKKILVIEDDEHIAKIYKLRFTMDGYDTFFATNGEDGIKKIISEMPDLIILDMMLPNKDGFAVLEEVKKNPDLVNIPILVLSNLGQKTDQDRALSLGANEYMVKINYSMQEVLDRVKSYLK